MNHFHDPGATNSYCGACGGLSDLKVPPKHVPAASVDKMLDLSATLRDALEPHLKRLTCDLELGSNGAWRFKDPENPALAGKSPANFPYVFIAGSFTPETHNNRVVYSGLGELTVKGCVSREAAIANLLNSIPSGSHVEECLPVKGSESQLYQFVHDRAAAFVFKQGEPGAAAALGDFAALRKAPELQQLFVNS